MANQPKNVVTLEDIEVAALTTDDKQRSDKENKLSAKLKKVKQRVWAGIVYPDSLPNDWNTIIMMSGLAVAMSPLHDRDNKKPHYHILVCWNGPTTYENAKAFIRDTLNGTLPIPCQSPRGYYRYFTHKDHPNKAQYDEKDIARFNGFEEADFVDMTKAEVLSIKKKMVELCMTMELNEYADLVEYVTFNEEADVQDVVFNNTLFFNAYLRSRKFRNHYEHEVTTEEKTADDTSD